MWYIMFFGKRPFRYHDNQLQLSFEPYIPSYLIPDSGILEATFLGNIPVIFHTGSLSEVNPNVNIIKEYVLVFAGGRKEHVSGPVIIGKSAHAVRDGLVTEIHVHLQ